MSTTTAPTVIAEAAADVVAAARSEHRALAVWVRNGSIGERPDTPNLDFLNNTNASGGTKMSTKSTTTKAPKMTVRFYRNGKPLGDTYNSMAHLALQSTKGIPTPGRKLNSKELTALLAENGITEPKTSTWTFELPNGVTIGAVTDGDSVPTELTVSKDLRSKSAKHAKADEDTKVAAAASTWAISRTAERAYWIVRDGEQVGGPFRSVKLARFTIVQEHGGPIVNDVDDQR